MPVKEYIVKFKGITVKKYTKNECDLLCNYLHFNNIEYKLSIKKLEY